MGHCAAVDVSLLGGEVQFGELVEGEIFIDKGNVDAGSFSHLLSVLGPGELHRSRKEPSHMTDQGVLHFQLHLVSGVDDQTGGRI